MLDYEEIGRFRPQDLVFTCRTTQGFGGETGPDWWFLTWQMKGMFYIPPGWWLLFFGLDSGWLLLFLFKIRYRFDLVFLGCLSVNNIFQKHSVNSIWRFPPFPIHFSRIIHRKPSVLWISRLWKPLYKYNMYLIVSNCVELYMILDNFKRSHRRHPEITT